MPRSTIEVWKAVDGFDSYLVSNLGRVSSSLGRSPRLIAGSIIQSTGYRVVWLRHAGETVAVAVHRLVAVAFVPRIAGCSVVNHLNGDKTDNRSTNLEWCTPQENARHAARVGRIRQGWERKNGKPLSLVVEVKRRLSSGSRVSAVARDLSLSISFVSAVNRNLIYRNAAVNGG